MRRIFVFMPIFCVFSACEAQSTLEQSTLERTLRPGQNIAEIVADAEVGTRFTLEAGTYRQQYVRPKNGHVFVGTGRVVFNGSMLLEDWRRDGKYWVAVGPEERLRPQGACLNKSSDLCQYREDLFLDGVVYQRVDSLDELGPKKWYPDGAKIYTLDDPTGKRAEFSVVPFAFSSDAKRVTLQNITVEKYASAAQRGAIEFRDAEGWKLIDVNARWNHGVGVRIGPKSHISGGSFSNNGQLGMGGLGSNSTIENVEIAHNNYADFSWGWEAGGTKFVKSDGLVIRNSCIHNNKGPGLWTDIDNINIVYDGNLVFDNAGDGIKHEISYSARIFNNTVARNGKGKHNWLWGSQILVQNSSDVEVYNNVIEVAATFGNGISVINQDRGEGDHGPWVSKNIYVHDNEIIHLGANGKNGLIADHNREWFHNESGNLFEANKYVVPDPRSKYVVVENRAKTFDELPTYGMEKKLNLVAAQRAPMDLRCN